MPRKKAAESEFTTYKSKPFVRCKDTIYYGNMSDPYVIKMEIKSKNETKGKETAGLVTVELLSTDESLNAKRRVMKKAEKEGLYLAFDIADVWLEKAMDSSK